MILLLSYYYLTGHPSVVMYNWRRLDTQADICMENLSTLNNFFDGRDESWFYLITVEIEAKGIFLQYYCICSAFHLFFLFYLTLTFFLFFFLNIITRFQWCIFFPYFFYYLSALRLFSYSHH